MKNRIPLVLYAVMFIFCYIYASMAPAENRFLISLFSLLVFAVPLFFTGFHASFLTALAQFLNFFWFRLLFRDINVSIIFIAALSVIPLISLMHNGDIKNKFFRLFYPCLAVIIVFFGAELMMRESPLNKFLDIKERVYNLSVRIDAQSDYLVSHDNDTVFMDAIGRKFPVRKPEGVRRVICLGSSSTKGHGAGIESYPVRLEEFFKDKIKNIEVINSGLDGARFYNLYIYFRDILSRLDPDLLIVYFGYNSDSYRVYRYFEDARQIKRRCPYIDNIEDLEYALNFRFCSQGLLKVYRWLFSSRLFAALKFSLNNLTVRRVFPDPDALGEKLFREKNVRMLADYCISRSIPIVLVPEVIMYDNEEYAGYFKEVQDEKRGVYYYQPDRAELTGYLTDSIHFNKKGYDNLAYQIGVFLLEKNIISRTEGALKNGE